MHIRSLVTLALGVLAAVPCVTFDDSSAAGVGLPAFQPPIASAATSAADPESAETCAMCHKAVYGEWKGRKHNLAWTDPVYQASIKKKKRAKMCYSCHIPDRVLKKLGRKPKTRPKEKEKLYHEGVNCVSCHEKDGAIHGPWGAETDAHKSVKDPLFTDADSSKLCMSCHSTKIDVVLPVGKDFDKSGLAAKGESCAGCHMPEVERHMAVSPTSGKPTGPKRKGRSHKLLGPNDAEFCATAFKLAAAKKGANMVLTIANQAGHRVPGLRTREFHFLVRQKDKTGKVLSDKKVVVNSENGLMTLESRDFPHAFAAGATEVEVVIEHHFMEKLVAKISTQKLKLQP